MKRPARSMLLFALLAPLIAFSSAAHAQNGFWNWGTPGFSQQMSVEDRTNYLVQHGLADPKVDYWSPFWAGTPANTYTGVMDTGLQNTYAINHDINKHFGIPGIGYVDVFTPLFGTNELAISATVGGIWNDIVNTFDAFWNDMTSYMTGEYMHYGGGYPINEGWDNGFLGSFDGYGGGGGGSCDQTGGGSDDRPPCI